MSFLPNDYKAVPKTGGNYMKLQDGDNKIRILSDAITGYEYWTTENRPVRLEEMPAEKPVDLRPSKWGDDIKHFWAFVVWNYQEQTIQILEITQSTIQDAIYDLHSSADWGDPKQYDITITRTTENDFTKYFVKPSPPTDISTQVAEAYANADVKLDALYGGGDPFSKDEVPFK